MKNKKTFIFTLLLVVFMSNGIFSQSSHKNHKENNGHKKEHKDKSYDDDDDKSDNNRNYNKPVRVVDLIGKDADYVYKELKNRDFVINRFYMDGLTTCKVWRNYKTNQCIKTRSLNRKVYAIEKSTNCRD